VFRFDAVPPDRYGGRQKNGLEMAGNDVSGQEGSDYSSPKEMLGWLEREIADASKATELRIKEAARFVTAYALGEISAEEAAECAYRYDCRWGEALPGVFRSRGMTDEEILGKIDETRVKQGLMEKPFSGRRKRGGRHRFSR
jgi:hypothetical protein